eukprot:COSAG04_NODE_1642_length_6070_cov_9.329928_5_plen_117_part_00
MPLPCPPTAATPYPPKPLRRHLTSSPAFAVSVTHSLPLQLRNTDTNRQCLKVISTAHSLRATVWVCGTASKASRTGPQSDTDGGGHSSSDRSNESNLLSTKPRQSGQHSMHLRSLM